MFARTAVGIVFASALVTAGAAPATATPQDRNHHALEVTACKQVRDHDHGDHRDRRFEFQARTDRDSADFRLRDRFDDNHRSRPRLFVMVTNRRHDHGHGGGHQMSR
jgi:hypothetical protein